MAAPRPPRVLIVAGSDSGGGAGIQADIKTVAALGGYSTTAVTAITVQDTTRVYDVFDVPANIVHRQIEVVLGDIGADAVKTGMLHRGDILENVAAALEGLAGTIPIVVDPVMVASSGDRLLDSAAVDLLRERLLPLGALVTPNALEAEVLTGIVVTTPDHARRAGEILLGDGARAALIKGGDLDGEIVFDVLVTPAGSEVFSSPRIATTSTHGTGCTLASAIATHLGGGAGLRDAVTLAREYVRGALVHAPGFGRGHGPLAHGWRLPRL